MPNFGQPTLYLEWGGDLVVNQAGGLQMAYGWDQVRQRILRRLLTNPRFKLGNGLLVEPDYIFDITYGAGLGRLEGELQTQQLISKIRQYVTDAVIVDEGVDVAKLPNIEIRSDNNHLLWLIITVFLRDQSFGVIVFSIS